MTLPGSHNVFALGPGHGIELFDGTLLVPCWMVRDDAGASERSHHPGTVCVFTSGDGGETWHIGSFVPDGSVCDPNETSAAQLSNGCIILSIRDGNTFSRCYSIGDNRFHFSPIAPLPDVPDPICFGGLLSVEDVLYMTNCNSREKRIDLTLRKSQDGIQWKTIKTVVPGPAGYSDLAFYNGKIFILYEKETDIEMTTVSLVNDMYSKRQLNIGGSMRSLIFSSPIISVLNRRDGSRQYAPIDCARMPYKRRYTLGAASAALPFPLPSGLPPYAIFWRVR